ncbi:MAG: VOC family protein [Acidobacteria bacterium]|nr:VOC family protein [Acidobacteriota bacterium]
MNLNQVTVPALDVAASIAFYQRLGLRLIVHTHSAYARFECPGGGTTFSIHQVDELPRGTGIVVYFECVDLDARVAALKADGLVFESEPTDQSWLWREAYLRDPAGNRICLYFAGANRLNPPWRLNE